MIAMALVLVRWAEGSFSITGWGLLVASGLAGAIAGKPLLSITTKR